MKLISIHKKTRGMRKKAKNLILWADYHKKLNIDSLIKYHKEYVKIWIYPFYRLYQITPNKVGKKNPKNRFRKQVFYQLIEIYLAWQEELNQLNQPYYLKIWLGDPEFMDSQVVAAIDSEIEYYNKIFKTNETDKDFLFRIQHPLIDQFKWERCWNGYYVWESDLDTIEEINKVRHQAVEINEHIIDGKTEKSYFIPTGDMWVGSIQRRSNIT